MPEKVFTPNGSGVQVFTVIPGYKDSGEAAMRKVMRDMVRKGPFTKGERDVTLSLLNLWFYHRNGRKGYIHPGRQWLAKRADVSVATVKRCLGMLRQAGVLSAIANLTGAGQKSTHYKVDLREVFALCNVDVPEAIEGRLIPVFGGQNDPPLYAEMTHHCRVKMTHSLRDTSSDPSQPLKSGIRLIAEGGE